MKEIPFFFIPTYHPYQTNYIFIPFSYSNRLSLNHILPEKMVLNAKNDPEKNFLQINDSFEKKSKECGMSYDSFKSHPIKDDCLVYKKPIDVKYWKGELKRYLEDDTTEFGSNVQASIDSNEEDDNSSHRFYLKGVTSENSQFFKFEMEVTRRFPGCFLKNGKDDFRASKGKRVWILVTRDAQDTVNSKGYLKKQLLKMARDSNMILFLVCICGVIVFVFLLLDHWSGYENPWKNIMSFTG